MRKLVLAAVLATCSLFGLPAVAADFQAGKEYVELKSPVPVSEPGKIEVVELFWYGCPHCYKFEPTINPWVEQLPDDVAFKRIPAMFGGVWNAHGRCSSRWKAWVSSARCTTPCSAPTTSRATSWLRPRQWPTSSRPRGSTGTPFSKPITPLA